jgi:hypothetical protein
MTTMWFQVEFYSKADKCWVPLFAKEKTEEDAQQSMALLKHGKRRIVKVTQITTVVAAEE